MPPININACFLYGTRDWGRLRLGPWPLRFSGGFAPSYHWFALGVGFGRSPNWIRESVIIPFLAQFSEKHGIRFVATVIERAQVLPTKNKPNIKLWQEIRSAQTLQAHVKLVNAQSCIKNWSIRVSGHIFNLSVRGCVLDVVKKSLNTPNMHIWPLTLSTTIVNQSRIQNWSTRDTKYAEGSRY